MSILAQLIDIDAPKEFDIPYLLPDGRLLKLTFRRSDDYQDVMQMDHKVEERWEKAKEKADTGKLTKSLADVFPKEKGLYLVAAKMGLSLARATVDDEPVDDFTITGFLTLARRKGHFFRTLADQWALGQAGAYNGEKKAQEEAKKNSSETQSECESSTPAE